MIRWIEIFAQHRIAANGAMILIILSGLWGASQVNNQFFPDFEFDRISVQTTWSGVSAEDMYESVAVPLQQALTSLPEIDEITTIAGDGYANLYIDISDRAESLDAAGDLIQEEVEAVELPEDADEPEINTPRRRENVADMLLYGDVPVDELSDLAYEIQNELLQEGFAQVDINGVPEQNIDIAIDMTQLLDTGLTLNDIATAVNEEFTPQPAGTSPDGQLTLQLRSATPEVNLQSIYAIPVLTWDDGSTLRLGEIATIKRIVDNTSAKIFYEGHPAIRISLKRTAGEDTLENAKLMNAWLDEFRPTLPETIQLKPYNETWLIVASQLDLLLDNGFLGMALVLVMLFFFLNSRLAFWVALGIPTSFFATFLMMHWLGITMNTISLFGFMIALGIIVDDAIVVGEQARSYQQRGMNPSEASLLAAKKMWPPVLASSLTTIAAFMPLTMLSGPIGRLFKDIPIIVTIVILASLIECFLILPGHLSHSRHKKDRPIRQKLDNAFNYVRDQHFRKLVRWSLANRAILVSGVVAAFILAIGMVTSRTVPFQFQPSVESPSLSVTVTFAEGTDQNKVDAFINHLTEQLQKVEDETNYDFIKTAAVQSNYQDSPHQARIDVELISDQNRPYTNQELVNKWRQATTLPSELDSISFGRGRRFGGESGDIEVVINGENLDTIKAASLELQDMMDNTEGLSDATDSLPYGDEQLRFELTPLARDLGLTESVIATYLRQHVEGIEASEQIIGTQTLDVRVVLPTEQRKEITDILSLPYHVNGEIIPLDDLINSSFQRGLDGIRAENGELAVTVSATLNENLMTSDDMYTLVETTLLPELRTRYGTLDIEMGGDAQEQADFLAEAQLILLFVLLLIYGILAWVFESWIWPVAVLITVPFGLTGAIFGHWIVGLPLSALSIMGLFGLSGIVINDSIVLISVYRDLRSEGMEMYKALEEAVARRLRPVILTTLTTMAGLTPMLFETSLDAQFLKPISAGLVFGLMLGTVLILLFVPAMLLTLEQITAWVNKTTTRITGKAKGALKL